MLVSRAVVAVTDDPYPLQINREITAFLHALAPQMPFAKRVALANLWLTRPLIAKSLGDSPTTAAALRTTTAPTMIEGGVKTNVLPQSASAVVNYRIHPRDSVDGVLTRARAQIKDALRQCLAATKHKPVLLEVMTADHPYPKI